MNYLVVICNLVFNGVKDTDLEVHNDTIDSISIHCCEKCVPDEWTVLVYSEVEAKNYQEDLVEVYLNHVAKRIQSPNRLLVLFHVTKVLMSPPDTSVNQKEYSNFAQNLQQRIRCNCVEVWGFHRVAGVWDTLKNLPSQLSKTQFSTFIDEIYKALHIKQVSEQVKRLSILKHRISHLWLPLDIDIQGVMECWNDRRMDDAQKYLKEVLEDKKNEAKDKNGNPAYYRQKLAKLQYIVAGEHVDFSQANGSIKCENVKIKECKPVKPQDKKNLLIDNKSIYDLILETASFEITTQTLKNLREEKVPDDVLDKLQSIKNQELRGEKEFLDILKTTIGEDQTVKLKSLILKHALGIEKTEILRSQEWTHLLILCGLEKDNTDKDFKPISFQRSPILYFMCLMDCMIGGECHSDVAKVLAPFDNWEVKNANPERIISFHEWFCALDGCLNKLRGKL